VIKGLPDVAAILDLERWGENDCGWRIHFSERPILLEVEEAMLTTKWLQTTEIELTLNDIQKILSGLTSRWRAGNSTSFGQGLPESSQGELPPARAMGVSDLVFCMASRQRFSLE